MLGLEGIERITSTASENSGVVNIELESGADMRKLLDDVKARVDAITTFPVERKNPSSEKSPNRRQVINVAISGPTDEKPSKQLASKSETTLQPFPASHR